MNTAPFLLLVVPSHHHAASLFVALLSHPRCPSHSNICVLASRVESCVITHSRLLPLKTACPAKSLIPGAPRLGQEPSIHLPLNLDLPNFPHVLHAALFPAPRQPAVIAIGFRVLRIRGFPTSFIPCLQVTTTLVFTCITTLTNTPPITLPSKVAAHRNISQHIANPTAYAPSHHDAAIA